MTDSKTIQSRYSDQASTEDMLNISGYVKGMAEYLENPDLDTPITIAIQGDWGTGKTSFLKQLKIQLEHSNPIGDHKGIKQFISIDFNTWQFSSFKAGQDLSYHLLETFMDELQKESEKISNNKFKSQLNRNFKLARNGLLNIVACAAAVGIDHYTHNQTLAGIIKEKGENLTGKFTIWHQNIEKLHDQMQNLIDDIVWVEQDGTPIEKNDPRREGLAPRTIVVFIDDLDRVPPEQAMDLLEAMKIFLDCRHCVFLLAMDKQVVQQAVRKKYGQAMAEEKAEKFFDKIIQVPFNLPVYQYDMKKYVHYLLTDSDEKWEPCEKEIITICKDRNLLEGNPRSVKQVVNLLLLYRYINQQEHEAEAKETVQKDYFHTSAMFMIRTIQLLNSSEYNLLVFNYRKRTENSRDQKENATRLAQILNEGIREEESFPGWLAICKAGLLPQVITDDTIVDDTVSLWETKPQDEHVEKQLKNLIDLAAILQEEPVSFIEPQVTAPTVNTVFIKDLIKAADENGWVSSSTPGYHEKFCAAVDSGIISANSFYFVRKQEAGQPFTWKSTFRVTSSKEKCDISFYDEGLINAALAMQKEIGQLLPEQLPLKKTGNHLLIKNAPQNDSIISMIADILKRATQKR